MTRKIRLGYVSLSLDDAATIHEALRLVREGAPKYWKRRGLPLAMYRLEKEFERNRFSATPKQAKKDENENEKEVEE